VKVLITGGGGFIGAWIARRLLEGGHAVRVFDRGERRELLQRVAGAASSAVEWICGDIARGEDVLAAFAGCVGVIHLAGLLTPECRADPLLGMNVNVAGTLNVFEAARKAGLKRVVYASSAGVYGPADGSRPEPATLYGVYKLAGEGVARVFSLEHGIASVGLRPFIVYGPGRESGASAGPTLACKAAVLGQPYAIPYTGSAGMVYIEDVAEAFVQALSAPVRGAHVFNLQGETASTERIVECIRRLIPSAQVSAAGAPLPIAARLADDDLQARLPGLPSTPLLRGIESTIAGYRRWLA
jgi:nucleoside-diphosphate-sugar epimerase